MRGNSKDYDEWEALGATGWSYKDVLPHFKKSERFHESGEFDEKYHGKSGKFCSNFNLLVFQTEKKGPLNFQSYRVCHIFWPDIKWQFCQSVRCR